LLKYLFRGREVAVICMFHGICWGLKIVKVEQIRQAGKANMTSFVL